jgi:hypothetical protein
MNYYLDKSITISGSLEITGSIIIIKSEETFNKYNDLTKLSSIIDKENSELYVCGNLIIPEYCNYNLNILGSTILGETTTLE